MRRIIATLLLSFCLIAGAQAQSQTRVAEPQQHQTPGPVSQQDVTKNQTKQDTKNMQESEAEAIKHQSSTCVPQPKMSGEGDPDAPQNHVEYGGGG